MSTEGVNVKSQEEEKLDVGYIRQTSKSKAAEDTEIDKVDFKTGQLEEA